MLADNGCALDANSSGKDRGTRPPKSQVLTLRQVPLELPMLLPQPSRRAHVQVTQLSIESEPVQPTATANGLAHPNGAGRATGVLVD